MTVTPDPKNIRAFATEAAFERWLSTHHATATELWLKIHKKSSGLRTVTNAQAIDVVLCWGWIDGLRKPFDEQSFLQRFTPRKKKSIWSQRNREHVERLIAAGRMRPEGLAHVETAKADGRWAAAYAPGSTATLPPDLLAAIEADAKASATYRTLNRQNLFALGFRVGNLKTAAGRARKIEAFVHMLARGETLYPNPQRPKKAKPEAKMKLKAKPMRRKTPPA